MGRVSCERRGEPGLSRARASGDGFEIVAIAITAGIELPSVFNYRPHKWRLRARVCARLWRVVPARSDERRGDGDRDGEGMKKLNEPTRNSKRGDDARRRENEGNVELTGGTSSTGSTGRNKKIMKKNKNKIKKGVR